MMVSFDQMTFIFVHVFDEIALSVLICILRHAWHPCDAVYLLKSDKRSLELLVTFLLCLRSSSAIDVQILLWEKIR